MKARLRERSKLPGHLSDGEPSNLLAVHLILLKPKQNSRLRAFTAVSGSPAIPSDGNGDEADTGLHIQALAKAKMQR